MPNHEVTSHRQFAIAMAVSAIVFLWVVYQCARSAGSSVACDFSSFYAAGLTVRAGNGRELYDLEKQAVLQRELFHRAGFMVDVHPPFEALFLAPLTKLSFARAYELWGALNVAFWILFVYLTRLYAPASAENPLRNLALCFFFYPVWPAIFEGQTSLIVLLTYTLTFLCLQRGREFWGGVFLGLGLFKFAVILPFVLLGLLRAKWRMLAGFVFAASVLAAISLATVGVAGGFAYLHLLLDMGRHPENPAYIAVRSWAMPTLRGFLESLLRNHARPGWINTAAASLSGLLLLVTAWQWRRVDRFGNEAQQRLMFAASLPVAMVTSPHLYVHDLTLMLLAILLVVGSPLWRESSGRHFVVTVCLAILYFAPGYLVLAHFSLLPTLALVLATFALVVLLAASPSTLSPPAGKIGALLVPQSVSAVAAPEGKHGAP